VDAELEQALHEGRLPLRPPGTGQRRPNIVNRSGGGGNYPSTTNSAGVTVRSGRMRMGMMKPIRENDAG